MGFHRVFDAGTGGFGFAPPGFISREGPVGVLVDSFVPHSGQTREVFGAEAHGKIEDPAESFAVGLADRRIGIIRGAPGRFGSRLQENIGCDQTVPVEGAFHALRSQWTSGKIISGVQCDRPLKTPRSTPSSPSRRMSASTSSCGSRGKVKSAQESFTAGVSQIANPQP